MIRFRPRRLRRTFFTGVCLFLICFLLLYNKQSDQITKSDNIIDYLNISFKFDEFIQNGSTREINLVSSINRNVSNFIGGYRNIPDTRDQKCEMMTYSFPKFHSVSVIITFHNEERSMLLRTITSILWRTDIKKLCEIILIDDFSNDETLIKDLEFLPTNLFRRHRNVKHLGLFQSRNYAAKISRGDYIVFLDSRCEVNRNWLEPLLARMALYPGVAASPALDVIDDQTFRCTQTENIFKGGFDWTLKYKWIPMSEEELERRKHPSDPYVSPTFPGGIFMISRNWFRKLEGFNSFSQTHDDGALEISLKVWLCGGIIEIVPCSRIGHVFSPTRYAFPKEVKFTQIWNSKMIAESWMDEYKHIFYLNEPAAKSLNLDDNLENTLKKYLRCKPFSWYLKNVFSELTIPFDNYTAFGKLSSGKLCLKTSYNRKYTQDDDGIRRKEYKIYLENCHKGIVQHWFLNAITQQIMTDSDLCLSYLQNKITVEDCKIVYRQKWIRNQNAIIHRASGFCLDSLSHRIELNICRRGAATQIFDFSVELNHTN